MLTCVVWVNCWVVDIGSLFAFFGILLSSWREAFIARRNTRLSTASTFLCLFSVDIRSTPRRALFLCTAHVAMFHAITSLRPRLATHCVSLIEHLMCRSESVSEISRQVLPPLSSCWSTSYALQVWTAFNLIEAGRRLQISIANSVFGRAVLLKEVTLRVVDQLDLGSLLLLLNPSLPR